MQMVNLYQSQEGGTIPKDVWGTGARKMSRGEGVSRVVFVPERVQPAQVQVPGMASLSRLRSVQTTMQTTKLTRETPSPRDIFLRLDT